MRLLVTKKCTHMHQGSVRENESRAGAEGRGTCPEIAGAHLPVRGKLIWPGLGSRCAGGEPHGGDGEQESLVPLSDPVI